MFDRKTYEKRVEWYQHDRFGMFIHWGLYAIPARGEWVRSTEEMPEDDYLIMNYVEKNLAEKSMKSLQKMLELGQ